MTEAERIAETVAETLIDYDEHYDAEDWLLDSALNMFRGLPFVGRYAGGVLVFLVVLFIVSIVGELIGVDLLDQIERIGDAYNYSVLGVSVLGLIAIAIRFGPGAGSNQTAPNAPRPHAD